MKKPEIRSFLMVFLIIISGIFFNIPAQEINAQDIPRQESKNSNAHNYYNWLEKSDRKNDSIIAGYLDVIDFSEKTDAIKHIALRTDKNFSLLIEHFYYHEADNKNEKEYILYLMLDNFFKDEKSVIESWDSFFLICNDIASYSHSSLRKIIMEKTTLLDKKSAESILLKEALLLLNKGKKSKKFNPDMLEESRIFFIHSGKIESPALNDYRQQIYVTVSNIPDTFWKLQKNAD